MKARLSQDDWIVITWDIGVETRSDDVREERGEAEDETHAKRANKWRTQ